MRRVPVDRTTYGPDDPRAIPPARGRPFEPGNPYRMRPGEQPGDRLPGAGAPRRAVPPQSGGRPVTRHPAAPGVGRGFFGAPRIDRHAAPTRSVPSPVPAGDIRPRFEVPVPVRERLHPIQPYRPCAACSENQQRDRDGRWPAAVAQIEAWEGERFLGRHYLCTPHFQRITAAPADGVRVYVTEKGMKAF